MRAVILAAGKAKRLDGALKPLVSVGGRRMIEWQLDALGKGTDVTLVIGDQHDPAVLDPYMKAYDFDVLCLPSGGGPARALLGALATIEHGPVVIAYADTWWQHTPPYGDWIGVGSAKGGRNWDIVTPHFGGTLHAYRTYMPAGTWPNICVGLYRFDDRMALRSSLEEVCEYSSGEAQMTSVLNLYSERVEMKLIVIHEWQDVGTFAGIRKWKLPDAA